MRLLLSRAPSSAQVAPSNPDPEFGRGAGKRWRARVYSWDSKAIAGIKRVAATRTLVRTAATTAARLGTASLTPFIWTGRTTVSNSQPLVLNVRTESNSHDGRFGHGQRASGTLPHRLYRLLWVWMGNAVPWNRRLDQQQNIRGTLGGGGNPIASFSLPAPLGLNVNSD